MTPSVVRYILFSNLLDSCYDGSIADFVCERFSKSEDFVRLVLFDQVDFKATLFVRPLFLENGDYDFHFELVFAAPLIRGDSKLVESSSTFVKRVKGSDIDEFDRMYKNKVLKNG